MARLRVSNDPGDLSVKRLILNARGETNSSVGRGATRPTLGNPRSSPSPSLCFSLPPPRIRITTPFQRIVTVNRFDCFRIDSPLDSVPLIYRRMFAHRPGQKRFSTFARLFFHLPPRRGYDSRSENQPRVHARVPLIEFLIDNGNRFDLLHARLFSRCFFAARHYASRLRIFSPPTLLPSNALSLSPSSLCLSFYSFSFLSCSRCVIPRTHTHTSIERV